MKNVLIAEDNMLDQKIIKHYLEREAFTSVFAKNGYEAMETLLKHPVDLVIIDIRMPHMNGLKLQKRIKRYCASKQIPIIMMSGEFSDRGTVLAAIQNGAWDFIVKPVSFENFKSKIDRVQLIKETRRSQSLYSIANANIPEEILFHAEDIEKGHITVPTTSLLPAATSIRFENPILRKRGIEWVDGYIKNGFRINGQYVAKIFFDPTNMIKIHKILEDSR